jgi:predicted phosphoribosyltransferase
MDSSDPGLPFRDRQQAGRLLARRLGRYREQADAVVLGLPRGGVVPAAEIASALRLPFDIVVSRKLGAPGNPELAIGAVAEGGEPYLDPESLALTRASPEYVAREVANQREEIARRQRRFRQGRGLALPQRATAILVDDGVATGSTAIAAIHALRARDLARLVLAIPIAPPETASVLRGLVDELVVLATPASFYAVGAFYDDFRQVTDDEVERLLAAAARPSGARGAGTIRGLP